MNLIPKPRKINISSEKVDGSKFVTICNGDFLGDLVDYLVNYFQNIFQIKISRTSNANAADSIRLELDATLTKLTPEGYTLKINQNRILIKALDKPGLFYGIQTLIQIYFLNCTNISIFHIPLLEIEDIPRFSWRGVMLDVGRHFHPVEIIKKLLDLMALLKMNRFHWHLTEDQGWRIEIKKYPKLTEIGSKRTDTKIGGWLSKKYRGKPHSGFYTQEEIREVLEYAKTRFITVIPEIEIPGHSLAAIASYPNLSCTGQQQAVAIKPGIYPDIYCAGKEETFTFLENVLQEVIDLFPSEIIHIGGDEAPKARWKNCPDCQARIKNEQLADEHELQVYFTNRIAAWLKSKNRRIMGWNEILGDSLDPTAIAQWWARDKKGVLQHLQNGRSFVMSLMPYVYMDYNYLVIPLRKTYSYDPVPKELSPEYHQHILGVETPLWTEWVPSLSRLEWQLFPRMIAVAEIGWTDQQLREYKDFRTRLQSFLAILDRFDVKYAPLEIVDPIGFQRLIHLPSWIRWPLE
jgi:hexosaminidase